MTVSPLFGAENALDGAICLFTDLTAVKDLEEQLLLKDSLATVGELTAGIAHEFRNGLATIHGLQQAVRPERAARAVPAVRRGHSRRDGVAQSGGDEFSQFCAAGAAHADARRPAVPSASARPKRSGPTRWRSAAQVVVSGEFGAVEGDEVLLRQAFSNLLRNAVEACAGASVAAQVDDSLGGRPRPESFSYYGDDNGPGIPPSARERVFQPFFTSKRNGTGLGLALVQKIIVFHNGRVVAGGSAAGGASLQVTLPLA